MTDRDKTIKPEQIKAARALLRLEQEELAKRADVSVSTIRRLEAAHEGVVAQQTVGIVSQVLEEAGVEFIHEGVRRRPQRPSNIAALRADLRDIALRSAAEQALLPQWSEADLYDESGLPK